MAGHTTPVFKNVLEMVDETIARVGNDIVMFMPIAIGKPLHIANAFYKRAKENPSLKLTIYSGLTLHTPVPNSDIERRFLEPIVERLYPDYPNPAYVADAHAETLPSNVELRELYMPAGAFLGNQNFQEGYTSSNYTSIPRDVLAAGCNVIAAAIAKRPVGRGFKYCLGASVDAVINILRGLQEKRAAGAEVGILGQVNSNMPYMYGTGELTAEDFTGILDDEKYYHKLFVAPKEPLGNTDYMIGLNVSTLIPDGGTLQIGIGSLADALVYSLELRHQHNADYREVITAAGIDSLNSALIEKTGSLDAFEKGIYGCSEMISDGFIHLLNSGIMKRRVYDHAGLQRLINEGKIGEKPSPDMVLALRDAGLISEKLTEKDFDFLTEYGILGDDLRWDDGTIITEEAELVPADLTLNWAREKLFELCLGKALRKGIALHAGFFIGTQFLYDSLMNMDEAQLSIIEMRDIKYINSLYGNEELKSLQRAKARLVNTTMMATLLGGAASETLESGQVVSGVGGQFDFVSMGHLLPDGRSILMLRSTRDTGGFPASNIVWSAGHLTIPRHLRDIFITEYGIADLRGRTDRDSIIEMLKITDSRFQTELLNKAKEYKKIPRDYRLPEAFTNNRPERLQETLAPFRQRGLFGTFPYGASFTEEEMTLKRALASMKKKTLRKIVDMKNADADDIPEAALPYLRRMKLDSPSTKEETDLRKHLVYALKSEGIA